MVEVNLPYFPLNQLIEWKDNELLTLLIDS